MVANDGSADCMVIQDAVVLAGLLGTSDSVETTLDERGAHKVDWVRLPERSSRPKRPPAAPAFATSCCENEPPKRSCALSWIGLGRSTKPNESTALRRGRPVETSLERLFRAEMRRYPVMPNARSPADCGCSSLRDPCRSAVRLSETFPAMSVRSSVPGAYLSSLPLRHHGDFSLPL
jgi:hypothetical protein